jgi:hypothetical protein
MRQDRFLTGILIGIVVLIAAALVVFFTRRSEATYASENAPDGVVHNYALAVLNKDYQKAYGYLADLTNKPTFSQFREAFALGRLMPDNSGLRVGQASITGDDATVQVDMVFTPGDPFTSTPTNVGIAQLVRQNGAWKISSMPTYNMWDYSWYQPIPKVPAP